MSCLYLQCEKGSRKLKKWVEIEFTLHRSPRSLEMSDCSRPLQLV